MSAAGPRETDIGVIGFIADRWGSLWQPRHHVLTRLARRFPVVWLEPAHEWRDWRERLGKPTQAQPAEEPGFTVYRPEVWLPRLYRPAPAARWTFRTALRRARGILTAQGCRRIVLYLWRPEFAPVLDAVDHDVSLYHIDDEYTWSPVDLPLDEDERRLIERVDRVFIHSPGLLEKKGHINPHTTYVPNGVDFDAYAAEVDEPDDLRSVPHPRVGYTGFLKTQLDWDLLLGLARRHPEWSFVFVGKAQHDEIADAMAAMEALGNVHFLGPKPVDVLARYPQHFDVCIMPYVADGYTRHIFPMKLHEYLASGSPAIGTRIPALEAFEHVVDLVTEPAEWDDAIARALQSEEQSAERRRARQAVAREHDWDILTERIARDVRAACADPAHSRPSAAHTTDR